MTSETDVLLARCAALTRDLLRDTYEVLRALDPDGAPDALLGLLDRDALAVIRRRAAAEDARRRPLPEYGPGTAWGKRIAPADDAPLEGCVRCGATGKPLRPLTSEPGQVCWNTPLCDQRREDAAKAAAR
jgi:hypothetical protein